MSQTLYVMQGLPGSGKSTIASMMVDGMVYGRESVIVCSTDDYFLDEKGAYQFLPEKLSEYHTLNLQNARYGMDHGMSVIVDNTNIQCWHCREYVRYALTLRIPVVFIRVTGNFLNIHGVPEETIFRMREQMENLTLEAVLASKMPWES